jgi:hypothetical protein
MNKALIGVLLLAGACGAGAQEPSVGATQTNAAAEFAGTSAAQVTLIGVTPDASGGVATAVAEAPAAPAPVPAIPAAAAAEPAATPRYIFGDRDDYRFQLGVAFSYLRFTSNPFSSNLFGLNTSLSYYTNDWFGVEGNVITGFSIDTIAGNHAKIFGGLGGIRIGGRRAKWEPWFHALGGGGHLQPQTALGSRSGVMAEAGGGVDYRVHARLSFRGEADWVYSGFFSQTQNNVQVLGGVVLHF